MPGFTLTCSEHVKTVSLFVRNIDIGLASTVEQVCSGKRH